MFNAVAVVCALFVAWYVCSWCNLLKTNQRGVKRYFGKVSRKRGVIRPGLPVFVEKFPGIDMVRVPTDTILITYRAAEGDEIRTSDNVVCTPEVGVYLTFPHGEIDSLEKMLEANVPIPLDNNDKPGVQKLHDHLEDVVMDDIQDAFVLFPSDEVAKKKLDICTEVERLLRQTGAVLHKNGIIGANPNDPGNGRGWVEVRIETTGLPAALTKAMQAPAVAKHELVAARMNAEIQAQNAKAASVAYADWLQSPEGQAATPEIKRQMLEVIRQRTLSDDGNYQEQAVVLRGSKADPLPPNLQYLSFGGGGMGVLAGGGKGKRGGQQGNQGNPQGGGNPAPKTKDQLAEEEYLKTGKYPKWDPQHRAPN